MRSIICEWLIFFPPPPTPPPPPSFVDTSIAPLERVKILLQVQGMRGSTKYHGVLQTMAVVTKEEGFFKLWKGNGANVSRVVPNVALKFTFNDSFNNALLRPGQSRKDMS